MRRVTVKLGPRSYPIIIGHGLLGEKEQFSRVIKSNQVLIVTNPIIESLYLSELQSSLKAHEVQVLIVPDGEVFKTLETMNKIVTGLLKAKFSRDCCLIALGGGVVGDICGYAAASYQRGVSYVQVPTTLLAQVDSSVGGKTAVNHPLGKNMIGAFHQPVAVIADTNVLKTLPQKELSAGLAEIIKYGLIRDYEFFCWLEDNIEKLLGLENKCLEHAIERSCINKAEVVSADEWEGGVRALLNFGHTFGHAIETFMEYKGWLHGEAVGVGMLMAADLSRRMHWLKDEDIVRIHSLLQRALLPTGLPEKLTAKAMRELMSVDKKSRHGNLNLVLLRKIGEAVVSDEFPEDRLMETLISFTSGAGNSDG